MGKSANKKKVTLPIRTIVPKAKTKPKTKLAKSKLNPKTKLKPLAKPKTKVAKTKVAKTKLAKSKLLVSMELPAPPPDRIADTVLDRLYGIVHSRRNANPSLSHSARLMSRGITKVAQKFGEEAVECLIEAVTGNHDALVAESADVLDHLLVLWVASDVRPEEVWEELVRREGVSGITEKASRPNRLPLARRLNTSKIP
jgi:phosphoribosyl-ATP pyrophosphohydrolase